ncbi:MAG: type II secretion system protein [Verrucomicrobiota bacterium]
MKSRRPACTPSPAYTLVEILVAMSIVALAIGAASQLSLTQSVAEDVTQKKSFAVNYAENLARIWQLAPRDLPGAYLLAQPNSDAVSFMSHYFDSNLSTSTVDNPAALGGGGDYGFDAYTVDRTNVRVTWSPAPGTTSNIDFPALRLQPARR